MTMTMNFSNFTNFLPESHFYNSIETINHLFSYSEAASENMSVLTELYHNVCITLGYVLYVVFMIIILSIYYFNSRVHHHASAFNGKVEYLMDSLFVLAPILIIYCLSVPAIGYIMSNDIAMLSVGSPLTIEIVGHQWYWTYFINIDFSSNVYEALTHYLGSEPMSTFQNVKVELEQFMTITTDTGKRCFEVGKYVILPVNETIRCELTSVDVIHSWAVPQLGVKVDAIPGRVQTFYIRSFVTGVVYGQCSEFCGENHGFMPIILEFVEIETFLDWIIKGTEINPYNDYLSLIISLYMIVN